MQNTNSDSIQTLVGGCSPDRGLVRLSAPAPAGGQVVQLSSSNSAATVPASVTVAAGQTTAFFFTNTTYTGEMNIKLPKETYFSSRLNYRIFKNERFGFDQNQPILTLSVYKIIMKDKKGEIRLTANDVFDQTKGINQSAGANYISNESTPTLSRYFMLSFTYNMRGVTNQMRKRSNW